MDWRISEPEHLLGAVRVCLAEGARFLASRIAPRGPIMRERNLNYMYKATWGMYASGVDQDIIARVLDWTQWEAQQDNGDFYFPEEPPDCKDQIRIYRTLTWGKVAAWMDHPVIRQQRVIDRILQYQHKPSGGVFNYIGDDPENVEEQPAMATIDATFFGHLMIALDMREQAMSAGEFVKRCVDINREHMANGVLYTLVTPAGELVTDVGPGERFTKVVDLHHPKQEFWHVGTGIAYLTVLYDVMRTRWGCSEDQARPYLDAALALLDFESRMPLDTYLFPCKCKVAWGAGELLRVLVQHGLGSPETIEKAYRAAERVAIFTFMDNQLPNGGWPDMLYPVSEQSPDIVHSYKPLKNTVSVPREPIDGSQAHLLPGEEIAGEFLGEIECVERGVAAWLRESD